MTDHLSNDGPMASYLSIEIYVAVYKSDHYIYVNGSVVFVKFC